MKREGRVGRLKGREGGKKPNSLRVTGVVGAKSGVGGGGEKKGVSMCMRARAREFVVGGVRDSFCGV